MKSSRQLDYFLSRRLWQTEPLPVAPFIDGPIEKATGKP